MLTACCNARAASLRNDHALRVVYYDSDDVLLWPQGRDAERGLPQNYKQECNERGLHQPKRHRLYADGMDTRCRQ